jgi:hypothetical protein
MATTRAMWHSVTWHGRRSIPGGTPPRCARDVSPRRASVTTSNRRRQIVEGNERRRRDMAPVCSRADLVTLLCQRDTCRAPSRATGCSICGAQQPSPAQPSRAEADSSRVERNSNELSVQMTIRSISSSVSSFVLCS